MTESTGPATASSGAATVDGRLALKPMGATSVSGYVDGAWWPRSLNLTVEITDLVAQLADRWGAVDRVSYDQAAWTPAARRVTVGGRRIRLDGFRGRRPTDVVHVLGAGRPASTLLVIRPTTPAPGASEILRRAGTAGNQGTIDDLLHPTHEP